VVTRKRELRRRYDLTASIYDRRYRDIQEKKYETILPHLSGARTVVDVGCGTGMLLSKLKGARLVVGVDVSLKMLRIAKKRAGPSLLLLADADRLPFKDESFDAAVSVTLLQNMPNPAETVRELARVVKPGGKVILTSLRHKHTADQLARWAVSAKLKTLLVGRIPGSEDVLCVARREK